MMAEQLSIVGNGVDGPIEPIAATGGWGHALNQCFVSNEIYEPPARQWGLAFARVRKYLSIEKETRQPQTVGDSRPRCCLPCVEQATWKAQEHMLDGFCCVCGSGPRGFG